MARRESVSQTMAIYRQYLTVDDGDTAVGTASRRVSNIAEIKVQLEQQLKGTIEKTEVQVQLLSAQLETVDWSDLQASLFRASQQ
jgi:hypothetical protein